MSMKSMKRFDEQGDLRVRRTHRLLWEALMAELAVRPFEEITVTDICERAMVHRTTFYKHYEDKYALLEQGMRQMYDALVAEAEHAPPSAFSVEHPPPYFVSLFEHVAEHRQFYTLMLCGEGVGRFQQLVKDYIVDVAESKLRDLTSARTHLQDISVPPAMLVRFFAGGVLSILAWWLENDMPLSPHQMARYLLSFHDISPYHS
jgi:AcrR family transcriptional regulator